MLLVFIVYSYTQHVVRENNMLSIGFFSSLQFVMNSGGQNKEGKRFCFPLMFILL